MKNTNLYNQAVSAKQTIDALIAEIERLEGPIVVEPPVAEVVTAAVTGIKSGSAIRGGSGTSTQRGVCWSTTTSEPTLDHAHTKDPGGSGSFTSILFGLKPKTLYYVRAYVMQSNKTIYGQWVRFTTSDAGVVVPDPDPVPVSSMQPLQVDGHYLKTADGKPFFYLADTAWLLLYRLTLSEIGTYLLPDSILSLRWDGATGLYEQLWKDYLDWWNSRKLVSWTVKDPSMLDFFTVYEIENNHYLLKKRKLEILTSGPQPCECEFYMIQYPFMDFIASCTSSVIVWAYIMVSLMFECPSTFCKAAKLWVFRRKTVAKVCREVCQLIGFFILQSFATNLMYSFIFCSAMQLNISLFEGSFPSSYISCFAISLGGILTVFPVTFLVL